MNVFTNCSKCIFLDNKEETCKLGKWDIPNIKKNLEKRDDGWIISGIFCPFLRTPEWKDKIEALDLDPNEAIKQSEWLKFNYIFVIDDNTDEERAFDQLKELCNSCHAPRAVDLILMKSQANGKEYLQKLRGCHEHVRVKQVVEDEGIIDPAYVLVDNLFVNRKVLSPFYICSYAPMNYSIVDFVEAIHKIRNEHMSPILFAGDNDNYFSMRDFHAIKKNNFKDMVVACGGSDGVYDHDQLIQMLN